MVLETDEPQKHNNSKRSFVAQMRELIMTVTSDPTL